MKNSQKNPAAIRAVEILSDGEWHDGKDLVREMEKAIAPGVAFRKTEQIRELASRRRNGTPKGRQKSIQPSTQIAIGKRAIARTIIGQSHDRGRWIVDPWPLPDEAYARGGFRVRDALAGTVVMHEFAKGLGVQTSLIRELIGQQPALQPITRGRVVRLNPGEVAELTRRVEQWRAATGERRSAAMLAASRAREAKRRWANGVCVHCGLPVVDDHPVGESHLCHPGAGIDCFTLVTAHQHSTPCRHCAPAAKRLRLESTT